MQYVLVNSKESNDIRLFAGTVQHTLDDNHRVTVPARWRFEGRCLHGVTQLCISLQAYLKQPWFSDSEAGAHRHGHPGHKVPVCPASPQTRC